MKPNTQNKVQKITSNAMAGKIS